MMLKMFALAGARLSDPHRTSWNPSARPSADGLQLLFLRRVAVYRVHHATGLHGNARLLSAAE